MRLLGICLIILRIKDWINIKFVVFRSWFLVTLFRKCEAKVLFKGIDLLKGPDKIEIGTGCIFDKHLYLTAWGQFSIHRESSLIVIGNACNFGAYNHITAINRIQIGDNCLTGKWVTISDNDHGITTLDDLQKRPQDREVVSKGPVIIGTNVWIGDKATILGGVTIGDGAVIAANAVVTKNVPPYSVVAGIPARVIKSNLPEK